MKRTILGTLCVGIISAVSPQAWALNTCDLSSEDGVYGLSAGEAIVKKDLVQIYTVNNGWVDQSLLDNKNITLYIGNCPIFRGASGDFDQILKHQKEIEAHIKSIEGDYLYLSLQGLDVHLDIDPGSYNAFLEFVLGMDFRIQDPKVVLAQYRLRVEIIEGILNSSQKD